MLNDVLTAELTAINQYFIHAKMCDNWGYDRLAEHDPRRVDRRDEARRACVIERILFLEGVPNMQRLYPLRVGETVKEQFELDLAARVRGGQAVSTTASRLCVEVGDNATRELLEEILVGEEEHADWLETQLESIRQVGEQNYLAQQLHD